MEICNVACWIFVLMIFVSMLGQFVKGDSLMNMSFTKGVEHYYDCGVWEHGDEDDE